MPGALPLEERERVRSAPQGATVIAAVRATLAALAALAALPAWGDEEGLEEVIVSASRIGAADHHATVLDEDDLNVATLHGADLLRQLPGFALAASGSRGSLTQARLRGGEANHLLVLIDGVAVNDPATGSEFTFGAFDLAGVRRMELLAGPQSAVWGSDALAGVLYLDTRPARAGRRVTVARGSHGTTRGQADFARVGETGRAAASFARVASDGTNAALRGNEADGFANTTANLRASATRRGWALSSTVRWTSAQADYDPSPPPLYVPRDGDRRSESRAALVSASARFVGIEGFEPWLAVSSVRTRLRDVGDAVVASRFAGRRDTATLAANFEVPRHRFNLTAEARSERFAQVAPVTPFGDPNQRQSAGTASMAGEYQARFEGFTLAASARRDFNDEFKDASAYRLGLTTGGNPRWFANVGRGVKNPSFIERFGFAPDAFFGNPHLRPETSADFEAGVLLTGRRGSGSLVVFANGLRDEIDGFVFDPAAGGFTARNRPGKSRRRGAELAFDAHFGRFAVRGSWSHVRARDAEGRIETRRPRHLASLSVRAALSAKAALGLGITRNGSSVDQDFSTYPATRVRLPGFRLLRADADFALAPGWRLRLVVDNALDARHTTVFGYRGPGRAAMAQLEASW